MAPKYRRPTARPIKTGGLDVAVHRSRNRHHRAKNHLHRRPVSHDLSESALSARARTPHVGPKKHHQTNSQKARPTTQKIFGAAARGTIARARDRVSLAFPLAARRERSSARRTHGASLVSPSLARARARKRAERRAERRVARCVGTASRARDIRAKMSTRARSRRRKRVARAGNGGAMYSSTARARPRASRARNDDASG